MINTSCKLVIESEELNNDVSIQIEATSHKHIVFSDADQGTFFFSIGLDELIDAVDKMQRMYALMFNTGAQ